MSDATSQAVKDERTRRLRAGPRCTCGCPYVRSRDNVWVCRLCDRRSLPGGLHNTAAMHREFYSLLVDEREPHPLDGTEAPAVIQLLEKEGYATLEYNHVDGPISYVRVTPTDGGACFVEGYRQRMAAEEEARQQRQAHMREIIRAVPEELLEPGYTLHDAVMVNPSLQANMSDAAAEAMAAIREEASITNRDTPGGSFEPHRRAYRQRLADSDRAKVLARIRHALQRGMKGDARSALQQLGIILEEILSDAIEKPRKYSTELQAVQAAIALLQALGG